MRTTRVPPQILVIVDVLTAFYDVERCVNFFAACLCRSCHRVVWLVRRAEKVPVRAELAHCDARTCSACGQVATSMIRGTISARSVERTALRGCADTAQRSVSFPVAALIASVQPCGREDGGTVSRQMHAKARHCQSAAASMIIDIVEPRWWMGSSDILSSCDTC